MQRAEISAQRTLDFGQVAVGATVAAQVADKSSISGSMVSLTLATALARSIDGSILSAITAKCRLAAACASASVTLLTLPSDSLPCLPPPELDEIDAGPAVAKPDAESRHGLVDLLVIGLAGGRLQAVDAGLGEFHDCVSLWLWDDDGTI